MTVRYPDGARRSFAFESPAVYVGRALGNDLRLAHPAVSSRHLLVQHDQRGLFVTHLAENGETLFHGEALEPFVTQSVQDSAILELGPLKLSVQTYEDVEFFEVVDGAVVASEASDDASHVAAGEPPAPSLVTCRPKREAGGEGDPKHSRVPAVTASLDAVATATDFQAWRSAQPGGRDGASIGIPWFRVLQVLGVMVFCAAVVLLAVLTLL